MEKLLKIGDIIFAKEGSNGYSITKADNNFLGEVVSIIEGDSYGDDIRVKVLETKDGDNIGRTYPVKSKYFEVRVPLTGSESIQRIIEDFKSEREVLLKAVQTYTDNTSKLEEQLSNVSIENENEDDMALSSVIEKAIAFVESNKRVRNVLGQYKVDVRFVVNEEKRTVVAVGYGYESGRARHKAIAKCNPDDVFNIHIGKAIALGRLMDVDVSDYTSLPKQEVK